MLQLFKLILINSLERAKMSAKKRVKKERKQLNKQFKKLNAFIRDSAVFMNELSGFERSLLYNQSRVMAEYLNILNQRLANWDE